MRVWFNRTFSSVYDAIDLIRRADVAQRFHIIQTGSDRCVATDNVAHEFHAEPKGLNGSAYVDWCLDFCTRHRVDVLVPGREATALIRAETAFGAVGTRILACTSATHLEIIHHKARFYDSVQHASAPPPPFRPFATIGEFDAAYEQLRSRYADLCIKPVYSVYGQGFAIVDEKRNGAELLFAGSVDRVALDQLRDGIARLGHCKSMLLMQYLDGHEWSVDAVAEHGRLVCAVPRKKFTYSRAGQLIDMRQDVLEATAEFATMFALNGTFNVQYKECQSRLHVLEVNPRMSGGIALACLAGPNLPYIALTGFVDGYDAVQVPEVRVGIRVAHVPVAMELS